MRERHHINFWIKHVMFAVNQIAVGKNIQIFRPVFSSLRQWSFMISKTSSTH